jgi:hypothetical protein
MKMDVKMWAFLVTAATLICVSCAAESISVAPITVTTQAELVAATATANTVTGTSIYIANDITFTTFTNIGSANTGVVINGATNLVINGGGHTISGGGIMRCFYIGGDSTSVTFNDMNVTKGYSTVIICYRC